MKQDFNITNSLTFQTNTLDTLLVQRTNPSPKNSIFFEAYAVHKKVPNAISRKAIETENIWINLGLWSVLLIYLLFLRLLQLHPTRLLNYILRIPAIHGSGFHKPTLPVQILLSIPGIFVFSFLLHKLLPCILDNTYTLSWLESSAVFITFMLILFIIESFAALIFDTTHVFKTYIIDQILVFNITTFILAPFMVFYFYNQLNAFIYIGLYIVGVFTLWRWTRSLLIIRAKTFFSTFYIFIYLCAVKIIPFLWLIKWGIHKGL